MAHKYRSAVVQTLLPPDLARDIQPPFAMNDLMALARWLDDPSWPPGTLHIAVLEGYLTALLIWPVDVRPGAWMPPIWNDSGWRLPQPIADQGAYTDFVRLLGGFIQYLDARLPDLPLLVAASGRRSTGRDAAPDVRWATGFITAVTLWSHRQQWRSTAARRAVGIIGHTSHGHLASSDPDNGAAEQLRRAIRVLATERTSRGPLGALPRRAAAGASRRAGDRQHPAGN